MSARSGRRRATICRSPTRRSPVFTARSAWRRTGVHIVDLGSLNGTVVDGVVVKEAFLRNGSLIRLGAAKLRFELADGNNRLLVSDRTAFGELHGIVGSDARLVRADGEGGGQRRDRAARRRDRHRQGAGGGGDSSRQRARREAVRRRRLRRDPGQPAGERAVRPREGLVHRRPDEARGRVRGDRRRDHLPRRDRRAAPGPAAEAAARAREPPRAARSAPASTGPSTCASSRRPTATCAPR